MRQQVFKLSVAILFLFSLCFPSVIFADPVAQANPPEEKKEEVAKEEPKAEKPMPIKEAIKALEPGDPRQAKVNLINWKIKYLREHMRAIELEYTGLCYKDRRHWVAKNQLDQMVRELRRILIH